MTMIAVKTLHRKWMKNAEYKAECGIPERGVRADRGSLRGASKGGEDFTQAQLASRMKTTQAAVARLESGRGPPSTRTLQKFAEATGTVLRISFQPRRAPPSRRSSNKTELR